MFDKLMKRAKELGERKDTEWAYEHAEEYEDFAETIEKAYSAGKITAKEHDDLALEAFYDYFDFYYYDI